MPEFVMPSLGADMEAGTLLEWLVRPGDPVHRGDVVAVVDTDKAAIEVECFDDGVVESLIVTPGQKVPVGAPLARITTGPGRPEPREEPQGRVTSPLVRHLAQERGVDVHAVAAGPDGVVHRADVERAAPSTTAALARRTGAAEHPAPARRPEPVAHPPALRASPMARRLAASADLDLATVEGSGPGGAISAEDVRRALLPPARRPRRPPRPHKPLAAGRASAPPASGADERARSMRQAIATLMERSNREIPHYYLTSTIDLAALTAWLRARNRDLPVEQRLVPAAALLVATARAAHEVGQLNGTWVDGEFRPAPQVDLGLVVSLRRGGIMVPVVTDAAARSVEQMMFALRDLVERSRSGRLRASELGQPSITVSSLGDQGVESVLGVIYPPQVALVGFGAVVERPWAVDGLLGVRPVVTASLAADHRASDGAIGARLLTRIDRLLQKPEEL